MSLTFYSAPMSTASITEAVLAELGIDYDRINLDLRPGAGQKMCEAQRRFRLCLHRT